MIDLYKKNKDTTVQKFEMKLAELIDNEKLVSFSNSHSALTLLIYELRQMGILDRGDEVLVTPLANKSVIMPLLLNSLHIKWVDVSAIGLMDMNDLRRKLSNKTKIIIATHWGGYPISHESIDAIKEECRNVFNFTPIVIEDCSNAFGTKKVEKAEDFDPKKPVYTSSFISSKKSNNICLLDFSYGNTCGLNSLDVGGVLTFPSSYPNINLSTLINGLSSCKNYGISNYKDCIIKPGFDLSLNPLNATSLLTNLDTVNDNIRKQIENAKAITFGIRDNTTLMPLRSMFEGASYSWFCLDFNHKDKTIDDFKKFMNERDVTVDTLSDDNCYNKVKCTSQFNSILPGIDTLRTHLVMIPCGWWLEDKDVKHIVRTLKEFIKWADEPQEEIIE